MHNPRIAKTLKCATIPTYMTHIRPFEEVRSTEVAEAGGKGASLGEMTRTGIPVPPGYVILSSAFESFLEENNLHTAIAETLNAVDPKALKTVEHAAEHIRALVMHAAIPSNIANAITAAFENMGATHVAVRSSATSEDGADAAWAGQLDSFLNTTSEHLLENVKRCWASLFTPRAIFYRHEKGLNGTPISVAVVVQKMVQSEVSGIAFSVHPITEDQNRMIIEAGRGLGEAIVSGQITPDSYVVQKEPREIIDVYVADQERALQCSTNGGNEWVILTDGDTRKLTNEQVLELADIVLRIEAHYGFPCDIEWAYEGGTFFITQSRPITTLSK